MHSKQKGNIGELAIATDLAKRGYSVFTESGDLSKVDLIALVGSKAVRLQIKALTSVDGVLKLLTYKTGPNYQFRYSREDFDILGVYCLDTEHILYVGTHELLANGRSFSVRLRAAKNNQVEKTRMWHDFSSFERCVV